MKMKKLAKELKDAGFGNYMEDVIDGRTGKNFTDIWMPDLSDLIKACGEDFNMLTVRSPSLNKFYQAYSQDNKIGEGETPEEAVANLWLRINLKDE